MDFVLALHSHLPYVLNHGRWPHGGAWRCEAALDPSLPLLERLEELAAEGTPTPRTIGFRRVLGNRLASPAFAGELEAFFAQRLAACDEAPPALQASGDGSLVPLVDYWRSRLTRLRELFRRIDADLVSAFRRLQEQGRLEIIGSAATHGYLPLLGRDESIRLQLAVGQQEHRRLFGVAPVGCWLPECAHRRRGAGARPPLFHADLEPTPGLPRRRVVPRVSQDPVARRLEALARQRRERGPGRQAPVRAARRARAGDGACLPLRPSTPGPGAAASRSGWGRHHRGAVRYGVVRALVVRGGGLPGRDVPRAARLR